MRQGGGKAKGSEFERWTGKRLSIWITEGRRDNLFSRNVLSGGAHTLTVLKGGIANIPGDLMAASPLAFNFLSVISVECKHHQDIDLDVFLRDVKRTSFLYKTINVTSKQAHDQGLSFMVIAKENRHEPLVFMEHTLGRQCTVDTTSFPNGFHYHVLCNDKIIMFPFSDLIRLVSAKQFITTAQALLHKGEYTHG